MGSAGDKRGFSSLISDMRNSFRYIAISFNMMHSCERLQNYKTLSLLKTGLGICL